MVRRALLTVVSLALGVVLWGCEGDKKLAVTEIYPRVGPYMGGDPVVIKGRGFQTPTPQGVKVYFGKNAAKQVTILSDTEIRVEPPAGQEGQEVDVEVIFDDSRSTKLPKAYKYIDPVGKEARGY